MTGPEANASGLFASMTERVQIVIFRPHGVNILFILLDISRARLYNICCKLVWLHCRLCLDLHEPLLFVLFLNEEVLKRECS